MPAFGLLIFGAALWFVWQAMSTSPTEIIVRNRKRNLDELYRIACKSFGYGVNPGDGRDPEDTRRLKAEYKIHRKRSVKVRDWADNTIGTATVVFPPEISTVDGAPARKRFEDTVASNLPREDGYDWRVEWPEGVHYAVLRQVRRVSDVTHRAQETLGVELGYPEGERLRDKIRVSERGGSLVAIEATVPKTFPVASPEARIRTQRAINSKLRSASGSWRHSWDPKRDLYRMVDAPPLPTSIDYEPEVAKGRRDLVYGVTHGGKVLGWDPTREGTVHGLIAGPTGAGKSNTARAILTSALLNGWGVTICDPKRGPDWAWMAGMKGVTVATTLEEMHTAIRDTHRLMTRRSDSQWEAQLADEPLPDLKPRLLYVDELAELFLLSKNKASKKAREEDGLRGDAAFYFGKIAALGRAANVHVLGATQRPSAKVIQGDTKANLLFRIGLGTLDGIAARMIFTNSETGDRELEPDEDDLAGRAIVQPGSGLIDAQVLWLPIDRARALTRGLSAPEEDPSVLAVPPPPPTPSEPPATGIKPAW